VLPVSEQCRLTVKMLQQLCSNGLIHRPRLILAVAVLRAHLCPGVRETLLTGFACVSVGRVAQKVLLLFPGLFSRIFLSFIFVVTCFEISEIETYVN